ncbi:MAG: HdaA/DnaA family protein [Alphaproteobacteria bacterium]
MVRPEQLLLDFGHRPALGREDFLVAPGNREAVSWLEAWPRWPAQALALCGPPGCGKSHLAQVFATATGAALLPAAELDREQPARSLATATGGKVVIVEDADRGVDEVSLLHLYNVLAQSGGGLLLTARLPPARWGIRLPDLASRLATLPVATIAAPDDTLMRAVLVKLFTDRQLRVTPEIVEFLLRHMERSFSVARAVVAAADSIAMAEHRPITVPLVAEVLRRLQD